MVQISLYLGGRMPAGKGSDLNSGLMLWVHDL